MDSDAQSDNLETWARLLRGNWETLAQSRYRDYFIASHRGCDDPALWSAHAHYDADIVLHELAPSALAALDVLELGCGVGRLAAVIAPRVRSYTGIDIAPAMIVEAEKKQAELPNARSADPRWQPAAPRRSGRHRRPERRQH